MDDLDFSDGNIFSENYDNTEEKAFLVSNLPSEQHFKILTEICNHFSSNLNLSNNFNSDITWEIVNPDQPVKLIFEPIETQSGVFDIVNSDNIFLNKVIQVFTILGSEVYNLIGNNDFDSLLPIVLYGENNNDEDNIEDGEAEVQIARMLPVFTSLFEKIKKLVQLALNLVNQMLALYNKNFKNYYSSFKNFQFYMPFEYISRILAFFNAIDIVYNENENLQAHWKAYKLMFHRSKVDPTKFGYTENQAYKLEKIIKHLDSSVLSGKLLNSLIKHIITATGDQDLIRGDLIHALNNKEYCNHLGSYLKNRVERYTQEINTLTETNQKQQLFNLISLFSYYCKLFESNSKSSNVASVDKDLYKLFWGIQKKVTQFPLIQHVNFQIDNFLQNLIKKFQEKKYDPKNTEGLKNDHLKQFMTNFDTAIHNFKLQVHTWLARMDSSNFSIKIKSNIGSTNDSRVKLIVNGIILAYQIKNSIVYCMNTHLSQNIDLKGSMISSIVLSLELLKIIELQFKKLQINLAMSYDAMIRVLYYDIKNILESSEKKYLTGNLDAFKSDALAAIKIIKNNLNASPCKLRIIINELCFDLIKNKNFFNSQQLEDLHFNFWRVNILHNLNEEISKVCDTSFFYWYKDIFPECFNHFYKHPKNINNLFFFTLAISDTAKPLLNIRHLQDNTVVVKAFKSETKKALIENVLFKFSRDIENELRVHIHAILIKDLHMPNPTSKDSKVIEYSEIVRLKNLKIFEYTVSVKLYIQEYLNKIFYDMTTLNLNDWKTYQQMRTLAKSKYDLNLHDIHLPNQTLEQGVDILHILRNINTFVQNFYYNLHSQIFIEITKDNNYITTVGMQQILNSLNTHGIGIVNSIVYKIYQFLINKLKKISNVINDEYIKSSLILEKRYWIENKEEIQNFYPYERAEKLMNDIKHYGKEGDTNLVDQLRQCIVYIGNALGFVRTLKAALTEYHSQSLKYFSTNPSKFNSYLNEIEGKDDLTKNATSLFNDTLTLLETKEKKSTNYLSILVDSFEDIFTTSNIPDIDLFFYLLPALTINCVENLIVAKDKITKQNKKEAYISDDGFIIGLVYLTKVFRQEVEFNALHWFNSAINKFKNDEKKFNANNVSESDREKKMSLKKVSVYKKEFKLLYFTYNSSVILFNEY